MYVKSFINYTGSKFRLLKQIIPLFPKNFDVIVELFCGSCVVSLNTTHDFCICNDKCYQLIELYNYLKNQDIESVVEYIYKIMQDFHLTKEDKDAYNYFREYYNSNPKPLDLFVLLHHSFNNNIRFNGNKFTEPFGERTFTKHHEKRLRFFVEKMKHEQWIFTSTDFSNVAIDTLTKSSFIYIDPPYNNSRASYMGKSFIGWNSEDDIRLFEYIDQIHKKGIQFAMSNTLINKGVCNFFLDSWSKKYHVYPLKMNYSGASYSRTDRNKHNTEEVLITNYVPEQQPIQGELF